MTEELQEKETEQKEQTLPRKDILKIISNALRINSITSQQAHEMRAELGVFNSYFTRSKSSAKVRRQKRKAQTAARRVTRQNGYKGQKMHKGAHCK